MQTTSSQPRAIYYVVALQIWEYFSFYGMRALLILYLTTQLKYDDNHAYALFSAIFAFSAICPIKFLQSAFVGAMEKNNIAQEYIDGMLNITSVPMLVVIVAAGLVGGLIGAVIGQKALKKHFIKAGLVSVK